jgi:hypothetical protein
VNVSSTEVAKRRAIAARLLALFFAVAGSAALIASPARAEKPLAPLITATNPASSEAAPAISTTPQMIGEGEPETGVIISRGPSSLAGPFTSASGAKNPTKHPEFEIQIFTQPNCQGPLAASGRADAFEDGGIAVGVAANALTTLSARQIDPGDPGQPSECSSPFSYWEGNVPKPDGPGGSGGGGPGGGSGGAGTVDPATIAAKPEAPRLRVSPSGRANDNEPRLLGSAPGAGSVLLYESANCGGSPTVKASPDQLSAGLGVKVADDSTTTYSAVSVGGQRSPCSAPVTYVEDSTAPLTRITMGPGVKTRKRKAVFRFTDTTGDTVGTDFLCKVDRAKWKPCSSPLRLKRLKPRRHVVRVRAVDAAGNAEAKGAKRGFKVVRRR